MSQTVLSAQNPSIEPLSKALRKKLSERNACFVLITCSNPDDKGSMNVEMTYEGDACLAAMLIENAQTFIHEDVSEQDAQ